MQKIEALEEWQQMEQTTAWTLPMRSTRAAMKSLEHRWSIGNETRRWPSGGELCR
jgi:hypothetical protein